MLLIQNFRWVVGHLRFRFSHRTNNLWRLLGAPNFWVFLISSTKYLQTRQAFRWLGSSETVSPFSDACWVVVQWLTCSQILTPVPVDKCKGQGKVPSWQCVFSDRGCPVSVPAFAAVLCETPGPANSGTYIIKCQGRSRALVGKDKAHRWCTSSWGELELRSSFR